MEAHSQTHHKQKVISPSYTIHTFAATNIFTVTENVYEKHSEVLWTVKKNASKSQFDTITYESVGLDLCLILSSISTRYKLKEFLESWPFRW